MLEVLKQKQHFCMKTPQFGCTRFWFLLLLHVATFSFCHKPSHFNLKVHVKLLTCQGNQITMKLLFLMASLFHVGVGKGQKRGKCNIYYFELRMKYNLCSIIICPISESKFNILFYVIRKVSLLYIQWDNVQMGYSGGNGLQKIFSTSSSSISSKIHNDRSCFGDW